MAQNILEAWTLSNVLCILSSFQCFRNVDFTFDYSTNLALECQLNIIWIFPWNATSSLSKDLSGPLISDVSIETFIEGNILNTDGGFICKPCNKFLKSNVHRHVRDKHVNLNIKYQCPLCNKIAKSTDSFYHHLKKYHKPEEYKGLNYDHCAVYIN